MTDYLLRILTENGGMRATIAQTGGLTAEVAGRHRASPLATAALGYGVTGALLLGSLLKAQQRVVLKASGNGPLQKLIAEADSYGHSRAYVGQPQLAAVGPITSEQVAEAIGGDGFLTIVKDLGMEEPHQSTVPLQTGFLDADLTWYMNQSEQTPSVVEIDALVEPGGEVAAAGGLLLQTLPGGTIESLVAISERLDDLPPIGKLLADGQTPEAIAATLFGPMPYSVVEMRPVVFRCGCSAQRTLTALSLLDRDELDELIASGSAEVDCHFCGEHYEFSRTELEGLL
ncbi:MAG: Hsp33 family molecular chaperone HslO [Caldilineaceae bacterium]|nr:Hsp33 family molecular chaperone HslO [Caldilineaceae bacterium]